MTEDSTIIRRRLSMYYCSFIGIRGEKEKKGGKHAIPSTCGSLNADARRIERFIGIFLLQRSR